MTEHPLVELVYDPDCPNVERARGAIRDALASLGVPPVWTEWQRDDPSTPEALAGIGSPSVLVNGQDVGCDEGSAPTGEANSCRVYMDECGCLCGAPSARLIIHAIQRVQAA